MKRDNSKVSTIIKMDIFHKTDYNNNVGIVVVQSSSVLYQYQSDTFGEDCQCHFGICNIL